jgi:hypothetical protein
MGANTILWFAVDEDGTERLFEEWEPTRITECKPGFWSDGVDLGTELPTGFIRQQLLMKLTWKDNPFQYIGPNYDPSPD